MASNKKLQIAYGLAIVLLFVGIVSYVIVSTKVQEKPPVRAMFKCAAGNVLFGHKDHDSDYGMDCAECHHHHEEDTEDVDKKACNECHKSEKNIMVPITCYDCHDPDEEHHPKEKVEDMKTCDACHAPTKNETLPETCMECHESDEIEDTELKRFDLKVRTNAFHSQCENCHKENDIGPENNNERCKWCHITIP